IARANVFLRPLASAKDFRDVRDVQWIVQGILSLALLFFLIYVLTKKFFGMYLIGFDDKTSMLRPWNFQMLRVVFQFLMEYLGRSLFTTLVFADLLLQMNLSLWSQHKQVSVSAEANDYDRQMGRRESIFGKE